MNNKGFTLVEMLATVVIVGILLSITTISIVGYINDSREKGQTIEETNIISAAQACLKEKKCTETKTWEDAETKTWEDAETNYEKICISTDDLKKYGYINNDIELKDDSGNLIKIYFKRNKTTKVITEKRKATSGEC